MRACSCAWKRSDGRSLNNGNGGGCPHSAEKRKFDHQLNTFISIPSFKSTVCLPGPDAAPDTGSTETKNFPSPPSRCSYEGRFQEIFDCSSGLWGMQKRQGS